MNKKTEPLSKEQIIEIINTMRQGYCGAKPAPIVAAALLVQANLGLRISDVLNLRLCDIINQDGMRYHLQIQEKKTGKQRNFTVTSEVFAFLVTHARKFNIKDDEKLFPVSSRWVSYTLHRTCEYLGYDVNRIGTHSFRKYFATNIYRENSFNVKLVQELLQHSSISTTTRYIGIRQADLENALNSHVLIV